jgi:cell division protein FtsI (penicillin-binding protein 3)
MGHELSVTSLQLAQLGSVIANGGFLVHPHIVAWKQAPGGPKEFTPPAQPTRVLKPDTVMTMRMMMRRVVSPIGTARHLHVIGYSLAGKTGTAQIYDFAHHLYTHRYNASFMGFAPSTNPRLVIVVTISGTTGEAGFGGAAAGPVFQTVMSSAMRRLSTPRDVPEEVEELLAKDKADAAGPEVDDTSTASLNPPTEEEMRDASADSDTDVDADLQSADVDPNAPKVPNFIGKTVKDVVEQAASQGVDVQLIGSGLSRVQSPAAGALLGSGQPIQVRFAH